MVLLRPAEAADLPSIGQLRTSVGWSVHRWALLDAMRPPNARIYVAEEDGEMVAVGSGIAYGALGVIGNMVVAAGHRRRGVGSRILESVLAFLEARGCVSLELYATGDGRPLYQRYGFEPSAPTMMATLPTPIAARLPSDGVSLDRGGTRDLPAVTHYDAPRFGADRAPILAAALDDPDRPVVLARRVGSLAGFAVLRPDGTRLGPFMADDPTVAGALLAATAMLAPDAERLGAQIPGENSDGIAWLKGIGAALEPWDGRMRLGPAVERRYETIYGSVIGALG